MYQQSNNFSNPELVLKHNQFETLKSLSLLLVQEVDFLENLQSALENEIENEKPFCLLKELQRFESNMIRCALIRTMGKQNKAARLLGMKVTTLNTKIKRYKIDLTDVKA
jgi:DNA-binding NtrC family response regulator